MVGISGNPVPAPRLSHPSKCHSDIGLNVGIVMAHELRSDTYY
jgi:hypothetical protein